MRFHATVVLVAHLLLANPVIGLCLLVLVDNSSWAWLDARQTGRATMAEHEVGWGHFRGSVRRVAVDLQHVAENVETMKARLLGDGLDAPQLFHDGLNRTVCPWPQRRDFAVSEATTRGELRESVRLKW